MMVENHCNRKISARSRGRCFPAGFSLVELMVVIAIMLLLAAMALPRLLDAQMKAYEASAVSFLKILQTNQEAYRLAHGFYADNFTDLELTARGPAVPGDSIAPDELSRLATLFPGIGPFRVYAAQSAQQPPSKTPPPPPPDTDDQGFGGRPPKKRGTSGGTLGGPSGGGTGSGGSGRPAKGGGRGVGTGPGSGRPRKGSGSGSTPGGTPSGGGTGGAVPSTPSAPQTGGGTGGGLSPTPAAAPKTNVVLKHNYIFTLTRPTATTWSCTVAPVRDRGNSKFFYLDQTGIMRVELGKFASVTSPQM